MKKTIKYYGCYRGRVVQCLNNGFCRIVVPNILEELDGDENTLPLAEPAQPIGGGSMTSMTGTFSYPEIDSIVWCFFEGGNLNRPVYFATSNVQSNLWNTINLQTNENTNKGNNGHTVEPTGQLIQYNKSSIKQGIVLDEETNLPIGDEVDITVEPTEKQQKMYTNTLATKKDEYGISSAHAANIHLDNERNTVTISAKNEIILRAPKIILDSTGLEKKGYILINSNEIDNITNNGPFRVMTAKVNIDSGINNIVLQTLGEIHTLKSTSVISTSSNITK